MRRKVHVASRPPHRGALLFAPSLLRHPQLTHYLFLSSFLLKFSDGVGFSWIDGMKDFAEKTVSDEEMAGAEAKWPFLPPKTKEAVMIRRMFDEHFPSPAAASTVQRWIPRADW